MIDTALAELPSLSTSLQAEELAVRLNRELREQPDEQAGEEGDFAQFLNPASFETVTAKIEPSILDAKPGSHYQFERVAYFFADLKDSQPGNPIFNRTVQLKDGFVVKK